MEAANDQQVHRNDLRKHAQSDELLAVELGVLLATKEAGTEDRLRLASGKIRTLLLVHNDVVPEVGPGVERLDLEEAQQREDCVKAE